jgi:hypothetical protein
MIPEKIKQVTDGKKKPNEQSNAYCEQRKTKRFCGIKTLITLRIVAV